ncbi:predicted protein [Uncinocarpus reesii 1704]|uniref:DNA repair protein Rad26 n=1 Tax=Uncinocarpus reesii (strain UAMH 1704) TaxID=336963 RepID=C4JQ27_UNCRE|nr:uncharacterized protein UREG_03260 [Uncinocarpus reesii 1704]EEP78414.1 predicted protein [Uncinocarpus reesii 1704]
MDDEELDYDGFEEEFAADELIALVDTADAAAQHHLAGNIPGEPHAESVVLQPPSKLLRNPVSFGDTDTQNLDASVLGDGGEPFLGDEQHIGLEDGGNISRILLETELAQARSTEVPMQMSALLGNDASGDRVYPLSEGDKRRLYTDDETMDVEAMMEHIEQLTREREQLIQELTSAKSAADTRAGEIAIIRANQMKLEQSHNRQMGALRSALDEEVKKHQSEIQAAMMESKRIATENQFLKQDLREESIKLNGLHQSRKAKAKADDAAPMTPSKSRMLPLRDGFDDDEIMASPSKSAGRRSKRGTPSAPGKRKRGAADDSPVVRPLELSQSFESNLLDTSGNLDHMDIEIRSENPPPEDRNIQFIRKVLNHRCRLESPRDLEVFATISFPLEPNKMFSSFILEAMARPSENYPLEYANAILSLWSRALKEQFYRPVSMFMSIIEFILNLDTTTVAPLLVSQLVPVLQSSGFVNAVPRFTNSPVSHLNYGQVKRTPQTDLHPQVNGTAALELLYLAASGCCHDDRALRQFWRSVNYDFILIMLNAYQPIKEIILVLNLLSYSIFPTNFGPILPTEAEQIANENYIIDRIANLLHEQPSADEGEPPYTTQQIITLRIEAMSFLLEIAFSSPSSDPERNHAGSLLATHPSALARVFRAMHDELDALYSHPPERELHASLVNGLTRLAYGIITTFPDKVDLPSKLRAVPGAVQKHLVVLTRLAFSDGPLLESGITDDTVEMAHEMLEDAVNPQEAEALLEAFRSSKGEE